MRHRDPTSRVIPRLDDYVGIGELRQSGERPSLPAAILHGLTVRDVEIARLLVAGESNREIGERLFISPTTVARHVANIFSKLGVDSWAQAIACAHQHRLG